MNGRVVSIDAGRWNHSVTEGFDEAARLRVPPHSLEAERALLGSLMTFADAFERACDVVTQADFYLHPHRLMFGAIDALIAAGTTPDMVSVFEKLREQSEDFGGLAYLNDVAECATGERNAVRQHAQIVAERSMQRRLIALSEQISTAAFNPQGRVASDLLDDAASALAKLNEQRRNPGRRVPILTLDKLAEASTAQRWLVKHVVPADAIGMLFGGSGTFKSFLSVDLACHVAHGLPWMGRKTVKGPVLYIAAEGGTGLWRRIEAWHRARRLRTADAAIFVVPVAVDLTVDAWRVVEALQAIGVAPVLAIVDTLSQTYGGEENSANEMAAYFRELGNRIRALWACSILINHHSGHQATERPRGSSAIRANLDFLLGVHRDEKEMLATLSCIKQKDGDLFQDATFALTTQDLGQDSDGDRITTLVARHLSSADEVSEAMEAEVKAGRGGRNQLLLSLVQNGMKEAELRKAFYEDCGIDEPESRKKAYQRARAWAINAGFIEIAQGIVITLKAKK